MSTDANKQTVVKFLDCFETKDLDTALAMLDDNMTWLVPGKPALFPLAGPKTKAQMKELLNGLVMPMKNGLKITATGLVAEGDKVAVEAESYGELPNGRVYNNQYHFLIELRGGKITQVREYLDTLHVAQILAP